ncbi:MAG: DUF6677 family protein [Planctomycetaceae bacterium]
MRDPRISFRSREFAAVLAFLIPGAGHFYQGRRLKSGIYFTGILFLFYAGMVLGDWQPVYSQTVQSTRAGNFQMQAGEVPFVSQPSIGFGAQVLVGLPALPAIVQSSRFASDPGMVNSLQSELVSPFVGAFRSGEVFVPVTGELSIKPARLGAGEGRFVGTTQHGEPVSVEIAGSVSLGRKVFGSPNRDIVVSGLTGIEVGGVRPYQLVGSVSRPFADWYQAPRDTVELDRLHGKLSHSFDIACVFTWIAGLLNLMAIWDAYDGPAYGYGDEDPEEEESDADPKSGSE